MLDWIDRDAPRTARMYWHDVLDDALSCTSATDAWRCAWATPASARRASSDRELGILFYEKHWAIYEGWFWDTTARRSPILVREREGVPLVTVYRRGAP